MAQSRALATTQKRGGLPPALRVVDFGSIVGFLKVFLRYEPGSEAGLDLIYDGLLALWTHECPPTGLPRRVEHEFQSEPPTASEFGAAMAFVCAKSGIKMRVAGGRVRCTDVRYIGHPVCGACGRHMA